MKKAKKASPAMYRHGDVVIEQATAEKGPAVPRDAQGHVVLADGKSTGHAHRIAGNADLYQIPGADPSVRGLLLVQADGDVGIDHEEHATRQLPPGEYVVRIKRKYDPDGGWSNVVD